MTRLFIMLLSISLTTLAGIGVTIVLAMGFYDTRAILLAAAAGAIIALPITWYVARTLKDGMN
ncbi:hypothetical protein [Paracoccus thiocyanatus]|uniref:CTP synthetase n=1 Tax=Paracoccus thiocyanatus TaxID=34006 RepID=A0A3D8P7Q3_9RHOB|nr:hypothetical protein [Paracoccus thiocyanatus]RDW12110.1 hypothetical protein DIE28_15445 [Paracoccus thiocyanatus]